MMQRVDLKKLEDRKTATLASHRFAVIQKLLLELPLNGLQLRVAHINLGPGIWPAKKDIHFHQHPEIQIEHVFHGQVEFLFEEDSVTLQSGQSLLVPPGTVHRWRCRQKVVMIGLSLAASGPNCMVFMKELKQRQTEGRIIDVNPEEKVLDDLLLGLLSPGEGLWQMEKSTGIFQGWLCAMLERTLPLEQWKKGADGFVAKEDRAMALLAKATRFIEENHMKPLKASDIALHVGVGGRQLYRVFEELTGVPPIDTLRKIRLDKAMAMLCSNPNYSIKAVAYDCGFHSHSYFTQSFISAFGVSPSSVQENE